MRPEQISNTNCTEKLTAPQYSKGVFLLGAWSFGMYNSTYLFIWCVSQALFPDWSLLRRLVSIMVGNPAEQKKNHQTLKKILCKHSLLICGMFYFGDNRKWFVYYSSVSNSNFTKTKIDSAPRRCLDIGFRSGLSFTSLKMIKIHLQTILWKPYVLTKKSQYFRNPSEIWS